MYYICGLKNKGSVFWKRRSGVPRTDCWGVTCSVGSGCTCLFSDASLCPCVPARCPGTRATHDPTAAVCGAKLMPPAHVLQGSFNLPPHSSVSNIKHSVLWFLISPILCCPSLRVLIIHSHTWICLCKSTCTFCAHLAVNNFLRLGPHIHKLLFPTSHFYVEAPFSRLLIFVLLVPLSLAAHHQWPHFAGSPSSISLEHCTQLPSLVVHVPWLGHVQHPSILFSSPGSTHPSSPVTRVIVAKPSPHQVNLN